MRLLVTVASRYGSTSEIGEVIAGVLRDAGHEVESAAPESVSTLDGYDAVILGSAVYTGRWIDRARRFAERHDAELRARPTWLFSSGPIGTPLAPAEESADALRLEKTLGARAHRTFPGRIDPTNLTWVERTITQMIDGPDGDFRDWAAVRQFAREIRSALAAIVPD